jgi:hypothetical protein
MGGLFRSPIERIRIKELKDVENISFVRGDLLIRETAEFTRLAIGSEGTFLKSVGGIPSWQSIGTGTAGQLAIWASSSSFSGNNSLLWNSIAGQLEITGNLKVSGQTIFNNVGYTWPTADGTSGQVLATNGAGQLSWITPSGGGGGGAPGGTDGAVQFNALGSFGGDGTNFFWDNTNKRLGLFTNSPLTRLDIRAEKNVIYPIIGQSGYCGIHLVPVNNISNISTGITFGATDVNSGFIRLETQAGIFVQSSAGYGTKMYFATTNSYVVGAQARMVLDHRGALGIGTMAPLSVYDTKLDVSGGIAATGGSAIYLLQDQTGTSADLWAIFSYGNIFRIWRNGIGDVTTMASNGAMRLGPGDGPWSQLDVHGNVVPTVRINNNSGTESSIRFRSTVGGRWSHADIGWIGTGEDVGALVFRAPYSTEVMRVTSDGKVGIKTATPLYVLHTVGTFGLNSGIGAVVTPVNNGDLVIETTDNTTLTLS